MIWGLYFDFDMVKHGEDAVGRHQLAQLYTLFLLSFCLIETEIISFVTCLIVKPSFKVSAFLFHPSDFCLFLSLRVSFVELLVTCVGLHSFWEKLWGSKAAGNLESVVKEGGLINSSIISGPHMKMNIQFFNVDH